MGSYRCAILTVLNAGADPSDPNGQRIRELFEKAGHEVVVLRQIPDESALFRKELSLLLSDPRIDVLLVNGGTGISSRDRSLEVVRMAIEKEIEGFGELFRMLSWDALGATAMQSRATAGIVSGKLIAAIPNSASATELAVEKLLLPGLDGIFELIRV